MILVKFPSRERPVQFMDRLNRMVSMVEKVSDLYFLFSFDQNDVSMYPVQKLLTETGLNGEIHFGHSKSKIDAVNRDIEKVKEPWDILFVMSDDMVCEVKEWDSIIRGSLALRGGLHWWPDGYQKDIVTLPVMSRDYFNRDGFVYHPSYFSTHCDNEQTDRAVERGEIVKHDLVLFRHAHPANDASVKGDSLHVKNEMAWHRDEANYQRRKKAGWPK